MASKLRVNQIEPVNGIPTGGGGGIIQVVQGTSTTGKTIDSTSYMATNLYATITPTSSSSKILIQATQVADCSAANRQVYLSIHRDIGGAGYSNISGGTEGAYAAPYMGSSGDRLIETASVVYLDSPNTTSAVTYKIYAKSSGSYSTEIGGQNTQQIMVLMEVSG